MCCTGTTRQNGTSELISGVGRENWSQRPLAILFLAVFLCPFPFDHITNHTLGGTITAITDIHVL
jgi:hypothetical protein